MLQAFTDSSPEQLQQVVSTNMVGTLLCTRAAMQVMQKQNGGGHIFNMDGAGADGMPTPQYAAYGATKAGRAPCPQALNYRIPCIDDAFLIDAMCLCACPTCNPVSLCTACSKSQ